MSRACHRAKPEAMRSRSEWVASQHDNDDDECIIVQSWRQGCWPLTVHADARRRVSHERNENILPRLLNLEKQFLPEMGYHRNRWRSRFHVLFLLTFYFLCTIFCILIFFPFVSSFTFFVLPFLYIYIYLHFFLLNLLSINSWRQLGILGTMGRVLGDVWVRTAKSSTSLWQSLGQRVRAAVSRLWCGHPGM